MKPPWAGGRSTSTFRDSAPHFVKPHDGGPQSALVRGHLRQPLTNVWARGERPNLHGNSHGRDYRLVVPSKKNLQIIMDGHHTNFGHPPLSYKIPSYPIRTVYNLHEGTYVTFSKTEPTPRQKFDNLIEESLKPEFWKIGGPDLEYIIDKVGEGTWRTESYVRDYQDLAGDCMMASLCVLRFMNKEINIDDLFYAVGYPDILAEMKQKEPFVMGAPHVLGGFVQDGAYCAVDLSTRQDKQHSGNIKAQIYIESSQEELLETLVYRYGEYRKTKWRIIFNKSWETLGGSILQAYPNHFHELNLLP